MEVLHRKLSRKTTPTWMSVYFRLKCLLGFLTVITMLEAMVMLEKVREDSGFTEISLWALGLVIKPTTRAASGTKTPVRTRNKTNDFRMCFTSGQCIVMVMVLVWVAVLVGWRLDPSMGMAVSAG